MNYFCGDTHGEFFFLNQRLKEARKNDCFFICGDFGYWDRSTFREGTGFYHDKIKNPNGVKIYFCDGNHEQHEWLKDLERERGWEHPIEIMENLFFCPRGSSIQLSDGRNVLFAGGADSIDKQWRDAGVNWFPQETMKYSDYARIDFTKTYDIVVSHTCPLNCMVWMKEVYRGVSQKSFDLTSDLLQSIFDRVRPKKWFFGHWHRYDVREIDNCVFTVLNMAGRSKHIVKE